MDAGLFVYTCMEGIRSTIARRKKEKKENKHNRARAPSFPPLYVAADPALTAACSPTAPPAT